MRGISPAVSYQDLHHPTAYGIARPSYYGSPMGSMNFVPGDDRSIYGDDRSLPSGDARSGYAGSFCGQPALNHRGSAYSLVGAQHSQLPFDPRASSYSLANAQPVSWSGQRASSYSFPIQAEAASRSGSTYVPELLHEQTSAHLGEESIADAQLEASIRRICAGADLDQLTKKGVRKHLETEFGVGLAGRKETINRIIETVLTGQCFHSDHE